MPITHMGTAPTVPPGHVDLEAGINVLAGKGSGAGVHFGGRIGIAPRLDFGLSEDSLSSNGDFKIHFITDEMANFDLSASIGAGISVLALYNYYNVIISKTLESHTPYFAYRNVYIREDTYEEDQDSETETLFIEIIQIAVKDLHQFFVGDRIRISERTSFLIEGMFLPVKKDSDLFCINAGFAFSF